MSLCNQFSAPNGEPSLLYAGLSQKYGDDKAIQIWNWVKSPAFSTADKDINGDATLQAVENSMDPNRVKTNSVIETRMLNFLDKLHIGVSEFNELKELTGYDVIDATDLLNKVIGVVRDRDITVLPKETAYVAYSLLGKKNKIRTDLIHSISQIPGYDKIFQQYKKKSPNLYNSKIKELILIDYLADAIHNNFKAPRESYIHREGEFWKITGNSSIEKQINYILARIKAFITGLFSDGKLSSEDFNALVNDLANDILTANVSKYQTQLSKEQQLVNFQDTIATDSKAKDIVENFQKLGLTLTGSLSIRKQGTLYRTAGENLHDLDFTVQHSHLAADMQKDLAELRSSIVGASKPGVKLIYTAFERNLAKKVQRHEWFKEISDLYPEFKVTKTFPGLNPGDVTISGTIGEHVIDLFVNTKPTARIDTNEVGFQDWQNIFKAKIRMGRAKDLLDFINFHPYNVDLSGGIAQNTGLRHFNFNKDAVNEGLVNASKSTNPADEANREMSMNNVQAQPKLMSALQTPKIEQLFNKFFKSNPDKFYQEITASAGKQQVEWLKDYIQREQPTTYAELATGLAAEMSYTVQINTAMTHHRQSNIQYEDAADDIYEADYEEGEDRNYRSTDHYAHLTAPGGTNYTENEISTPAIVPSIKGHAQFSTDNGIGWFRSDEQIVRSDEDNALGIMEETDAKPTTRRILEVQSDLFQKGRNSEYLAAELIDGTPDEDFERGEELHNIRMKYKEQHDEGKISYAEMLDLIDKAQPTLDQETVKQNQFLQLLNKDNNWVTFFVKSIVQDSAKKGYESVLFPAGETAAKIEGHETLANELTRIDTSIKALKEKNIQQHVVYLFGDARASFNTVEEADKFATENNPQYDGQLYVDKNLYVNESNIEEEIKSLEQKKADLKSQGIEKLKPIESFYETRVQNVLNKQYGKQNVERITDEHGNDWFKVSTQHGYNLINYSKSTAPETSIPRDRFNAKTLPELNKTIESIYTEAGSNPSKQFTIPLVPTDIIWLDNKERVTGAQLANLLDKDNVPPNVRFENSMFASIQNIPKNFAKGLIMEDGNPLNLDPTVIEKQMKLIVAQIRDIDGQPTGKYFDLEVQHEVLNTILFQFYNIYSDLQDSTDQKGKLAGKSTMKYMRDEVHGKLERSRQLWGIINDGKSKKIAASENSRSMVDTYTNIINSFYIAKEQNHLWNFAIERLRSMKIKMKEGEIIETGADGNAYIEDENGELQIEEGAITKDRGDSSFEMDMKDTMSTDLKLWFMSTPESKFMNEPKPEDVTADFDSYIRNPETRSLLQRGLKSDLIMTAKNAKDLGITALSNLSPKLISTERDSRSQKTIIIDGKPLRLSAIRTWTTADSADAITVKRIQEQEGHTPAEGDVVLHVTPYVQRTHVLAPEVNFLGANKLANFEQTFQDASALLAGREPSVEGYLAALKATGNANMQRIAERLEKAIEDKKDHIVKQFVAVMSSQYQRMLMVLMTRSKDGYLEPSVIDSNRGSEVQTLQRYWQEAQKTAGLLTKNAAGQTIIDEDQAKEFQKELTLLYSRQPRAYQMTKEDDKLHPKEYSKKRNKKDLELAQQKKDWVVEKRDYFKRLSTAIGITMDDKAIAELIPDRDTSLLFNQLSKGLSLNNMYAGISEEGKPIGLVDVLAWRLTQAARPEELENGEDYEAYKANNPLYVENTAIKILAKAQLKYTTQVYSQTHKSAEGKTIYSFGLNSAVSHAVRKFKEDEAYRQSFQNSYFAKNSWLLSALNPSVLSKFELVYLDGLKNRYGSRDGVTRPDMSDREQWLTLLGLFQNSGRETGHMVSLTHSDKTKTPVFMNAPRLADTRVRKNGKLYISDTVLDTMYRSVFLSEHQRAIQPGGENIRNYANGKKYFYLFPAFNHQQMSSAVKERKLTEGEMKAIWNQGKDGQWVLNNQDNVLFEATAKKLIARQLNEMIEATKQSWTDSKLIKAGLPGSKWYYNGLLKGIGLSQAKEGNKFVWMDGEERVPDELVQKLHIDLAAADYTLNSFLFNTGLSQLFYGDPANAFKAPKGTTDREENVLTGKHDEVLNATLIEYGKRLAKDIAPRKDGDTSHSPGYTSVTAEDWEPVIHELSQIPSYKKPANATDAQEIWTMREYLNDARTYGDVTQEQYNKAIGIITKANGKFYNFGPDLESIILQPRKNVEAGLMPPMEGMMPYTYTKASAFPLYPPFIEGLELDKLRIAMEHPETGIDRLNFISAKKMGGPVKILKLFDDNGKVRDDTFTTTDWIADSRQYIPREFNGRQQDNPYDEDKDAILTVSQMNKNITEKIPTIQKKFIYRGKEKSGAELRQIKEDIRKQLITQSHAKFLDKVGAIYDVDKDVIRFKDKKKFYNLLAKEAKDRDGYTVNDLLALTSYMEGQDELVVPLAFTPSFSKFEGMMMSMVKKIVKIKMPGHSFIQASPAGFRTLATWEDSNLDRSQIVWTKPFDGNLKTAHIGEDGAVVPAQVLVGFNYFSDSRLNIQDFIKEVDNKKMLDTEKMPPELFQLVGARIPNQGHSSMLPIEIVGFLPQNMGDMIVVPAGITKQMGADFDVDKLYTYHRSYTADGGKLSAAEGLDNDYFDVHWSTLTNPEMLDSIMSPLDKNDLKDMADELSPAEGKVPYYFSPTYQLSDFQSMKGAKVLVGQTSLALTSNAVLQTSTVGLAEWVVEEAGKYTQSTAITVADEEGNPLHLSELSGFGETTYKGERRTKSDNVQIQQSESVDHAKNRVIDKINLDPNTSAASLAMSRLQTADQGTPGEADFVPGKSINLEYNALLLMQPIVREFSAALSTANDTLSVNFESKVKDKVFIDLTTKYETDVDWEKVDEVLLNPEKMREALKLKPGTTEFNTLQQAALKLFKQFDDIGSQLVTLQSTMAQDTRGAGKDMLGVLNTVEKRAKPNTTSEKFLSNTQQVFGNKKNGLTEVGVTYDSTVNTALDLYSPELPYKALQKSYNSVMELAGKDGLNNEQKKLVFNAMKSFAFNSKKLGLYSDAYTERVRLLFSHGSNLSLAQRLLSAKSTWGKNDYLLQRLQTDIDPNGVRPDMIEYNASKASMADDVENSKAWLTMLTSEDPVKKALGFDMVRYNYLIGGLQGTRNFIKYIPWATIEGSQIAFGLREQFNEISKFNDSEALVEQIFQHNPHLARQLSAELDEIGKPAIAPDTFALPIYNADDNTGNLAAALAVTMTTDDGKKFTDYPTYLSYRKENKWYLYKNMGMVPGTAKPLFARIDTLGDSKLQLSEYAESAGQVDQKGLRSVVADNRAPWFEHISPEYRKLSNSVMDSLTTAGAHTIAMRQVGITKETGGLQDIINSMSVIARDGGQPAHIRAMAEVLGNMQRNPAEAFAYENVFGMNRAFSYEFSSLPSGTAATFNSGSNKMTFSIPGIGNKQLLAANIIHENIHYHTALMTMAMEGEASWAARGVNSRTLAKLREAKAFIDGHPELQQKLSAVEDARKEAMAELRKRVVTKFGSEYFELLKTDHDTEYGKLYYSLNNATEFVSHILSDSRTITFLNSIKSEDKTSLLNKIKDLFAKVWNALQTALGVQNGTLAETSVKRTLDLLTHDMVLRAPASVMSSTELFSDLSNASINTKEISAIDKVIGKLTEQKQDLINSYTGVTDNRSRLDKRYKIKEIEEDIKKLADSQDLMQVSEIGKKHLQWVARIDAKEKPNENEIMNAVRIAQMWRGIVELLYGDSATSVDPELSQLANQSGNFVHRLLSKGKDYMVDVSAGVIRSTKDFEQVEDISMDQKLLRSLSSAAKSTVTSHVANFIETTARQRDEECYEAMQKLNKLEKNMLAHTGGKKGLEALYNKMTQTSAKSLGLTMQYSKEWFEWRRSIIAKRNATIADIEKNFGNDTVGAIGPKKAAWKAFWKEVDKKAVFVDTRRFFNPTTGELIDNPGAREELAIHVGADHVEILLARAQERYLKYIEDKNTHFDVLDERVVLHEHTAEEAEVMKKEWQNKHSPNVFFDRNNSARSFSEATEEYIAMAPKLSSKELWNDDYKGLMEDSKVSQFYNDYKNMIDEFLSYMPKAVQDRQGADFLPAVRKEVMANMFNVVDWVKTFNEKFVRSITATGWEEQMSDRAFDKIPIDFVNANKLVLEDRSKDLIGIGRLFAMMAIHYKHFSAAKDYIDMGETILKEVNRAQIEGSTQMEQNGKVVTVQKGLRNTLDALKYLKDYSMFRKPKELEGNTNSKLYSKNTGKGSKFSLNLIKHIKMTRDVKKLTAQREELEEKFRTGELTEEEYGAAIEPINQQLGKYEGFTMYGSKIGDKLIGINQLKALSYNPFSAVANVTFGLISISIHAAGGRDFTHAHVAAARTLMTRALFDKKLATKVMGMMDRAGIIGDYVESKYGKAPEFRDNKSTWKKIADPFGMMRETDFFMKGVTTVAMAMHDKITPELSIWDSLDENGYYDSAKHGPSEDWVSGTSAKQQTKWDKFRNKAIRVNVILHGNQDKNAPKMINKTILGRLLGQFRASWLPEGWYNRFQDERFDENLGRAVKGRYRSFFNLDNQIGIGGYAMVMGRQLIGLLPGVKVNPFSGITTIGGKLLTDEESVDTENMRKNLSELGYFLVLAGSIAMLKHLNAGDDDKKSAYTTQVLLNMLIRGKQDIDFYASPGVFESVTKNVIPATSVLTDYGKAIGATMRLIIDDDYTFGKWALKMTKAGIPIPQTTLINKSIYMANKDLDALQ
jgi:hypothetical protein